MDWKDADSAFEQQLALNKQQIANAWPDHWKFARRELDWMQRQDRDIDCVVDIGCGVGAFCVVAATVGLDYIGYDYSEKAIELAKTNWSQNSFHITDYKELTSAGDFSRDVIVANALCDVLPNGDECFEHLLKIDCPQLLILRACITFSEQSHYEPYVAYGEVDTGKFVHNANNLGNMIRAYGYRLYSKDMGDGYVNIRLTKK